MGYEYLRNESIIRSKTREFFGVGTVVTASTYLVSVVDFMLIGVLLGADAVAAAGLCDSFVDVAELFGFVLSSGGPVAAGILLGKRRLRQANGVFTLSLLLTLAGGLLCWCLLPFCGFFSGVLSNNGAIANDVARYAFFTLLSSPFVGVNLVLSSFAILDDRSKLAMGSVVAANGVNIVLDVVFMKYLRMGVAGAAAASLLGNAAGILVVLPYLLSKKRTFRFVLRADDLRETGRELASSCSSFATDKASRIFSGLTVNLLLMYFVGNIGVALYAVYSQLRFILRILAGGALQTISTLGSMLYGERDFYGLRKMLSLLSKYTYALVAALMAGLFCFSAPFLNSYGIAAEPDTVLSLRIMLLSLPFLWLNDLLARLYPSVQRQRLSVLLLTLQNVVLKILLLLLCVAAISRLHWRSVPPVAVGGSDVAAVGQHEQLAVPGGEAVALDGGVVLFIQGGFFGGFPEFGEIPFALLIKLVRVFDAVFLEQRFVVINEERANAVIGHRVNLVPDGILLENRGIPVPIRIRRVHVLVQGLGDVAVHEIQSRGVGHDRRIGRIARGNPLRDFGVVFRPSHRLVLDGDAVLLGELRRHLFLVVGQAPAVEQQDGGAPGAFKHGVLLGLGIGHGLGRGGGHLLGGLGFPVLRFLRDGRGRRVVRH